MRSINGKEFKGIVKRHGVLAREIRTNTGNTFDVIELGDRCSVKLLSRSAYRFFRQKGIVWILEKLKSASCEEKSLPIRPPQVNLI